VKFDSYCEHGTFLGEDGICHECHWSCDECVGDSHAECIHCKNKAHIELHKHLYWGSCECDEGFFLNDKGDC